MEHSREDRVLSWTVLPYAVILKTIPAPERQTECLSGSPAGRDSQTILRWWGDGMGAVLFVFLQPRTPSFIIVTIGQAGVAFECLNYFIAIFIVFEPDANATAHSTAITQPAK